MVCHTLCHRLIESQNGWGEKRPLGPSDPNLPQTGSPTAEHPEPHPDSFWRHPRRFPGRKCPSFSEWKSSQRNVKLSKGTGGGLLHFCKSALSHQCGCTVVGSPCESLPVWETGQSLTLLTAAFLRSCLIWTSNCCCLVLSSQQTVPGINSHYEWKYHRLFANMIFVFLGTSCDKWFQVTSSWLHTSHCQILSCVSDLWYSYLLSCPAIETQQDATVQRYHLICTGSSFPHASNPATFFICTKCQCPFPHQTANHNIPFFIWLCSTFSLCSSFFLYSCKQCSLTVNIRLGPSENFLLLQGIYFLLGPEEMQRPMFLHISIFHEFYLQFSWISHLRDNNC